MAFGLGKCVTFDTYVICRAGWMMGEGPIKDKGFVQKLMRQLHDGKREFNVADEVSATPTCTRDFARNVRLLLGRRCPGLNNMVCQGEVSQLEGARALVDELGIGDTVDIHPVGSACFAETYFSPRPDCERLLNRTLALRGLGVMRPRREALSDYVRREYAGYIARERRIVVPQVRCTHLTRPVDRLLNSEDMPRNRA